MQKKIMRSDISIKERSSIKEGELASFFDFENGKAITISKGTRFAIIYDAPSDTHQGIGIPSNGDSGYTSFKRNVTLVRTCSNYWAFRPDCN